MVIHGAHGAPYIGKRFGYILGARGTPYLGVLLDLHGAHGTPYGELHPLW
jgi:ribosomal protein L35AE/L33A